MTSPATSPATSPTTSTAPLGVRTNRDESVATTGQGTINGGVQSGENGGELRGNSGSETTLNQNTNAGGSRGNGSRLEFLPSDNRQDNADTQATAYALAAMASAVFLGSQLLAHASVGAISRWDVIVSIFGTALLAWLYRQQLQGQPMIARVFTNTKAKRLLASPEVLVLPLSLALLSFVPTLERDGHGAVGLALRFAIGLFVIASVSEHGASWLAMAALVTMVFHPWDHPISVAAIFVGLALLVLGLANLARRNTQSEQHSPQQTRQQTEALRAHNTIASGSPSMRRRRQQHWAVASLIALAIGGGLLLEPSARKLTSRQANASDFGQSSSASTSISRNGTFTALSRSSSLELAYRPTRSTDVVLRVYTYAQAPVFLRTQTFDTWTGKTWVESSEPKREEAIRIGLWEARPIGVERVKQQFDLNSYNPEAAANGLVRTVVQAQTKLNGVVPVPTEALGAIWLLDGADQTNEFLSSTMFWRTDGTASTEREKGASPIYTVLHDMRSSGIINDGTANARAAAANGMANETANPTAPEDPDSSRSVPSPDTKRSVPNPDAERSVPNPDALQRVKLPPPEWSSTTNISPAVQQLAKEIVGPATTSSEKVQRIRTWMTQNVAYNLTAKDPGKGADPIDYLLFTSKEGSCTHFATATAALLRSVGVPTRISTGFVAQEQPRVSQFVVRGKDAHAWAEVPLIDGDWLQVDTTIGAREVVRSSASNRARTLAVLALFIAGAVLLVAGARMLKRILRRRQASTASVYGAELVRLARRLALRVPPDCSTAKLARLLDNHLTNHLTNEPANQPTGQPANESSAAGRSWIPGSLGAFGQQLEAASFGSVPIDLSGGPKILQAAFRRARSQRWEQRRLRLTYLVRRNNTAKS
jgi:transglutaminase-like putative cysteine protease/Tfp pilus assembly protein PilV